MQAASQSGSYFLYHPDFRNSYVETPGIAAACHLMKKNTSFRSWGGRCNALRASLLGMAFKRQDILIQDTSAFNNFTHATQDKDAGKRAYAQALIRIQIRPLSSRKRRFLHPPL
ncbi:MAG: hypothetical protein QM760_19210 [Nibricoccus sp.]